MERRLTEFECSVVTKAVLVGLILVAAALTPWGQAFVSHNLGVIMVGTLVVGIGGIALGIECKQWMYWKWRVIAIVYGVQFAATALFVRFTTGNA